MNGPAQDNNQASQLFDQLVGAVTCKSILSTFHDLCDCLGLTNTDHRKFYKQLKGNLTSWRAQSLWVKLDKRAAHRDYRKMEVCQNTKVLIIGAGPCGLRMAIEVALMGGRAVVVEKRDRFSRNNVLHLWNFVIADLKNLGAKKFFGKFCAGSIEHISIRQLQCILMKVALLLGVEVHVNVAFEELLEPPKDQSTGMGWRCRVSPSNHAVSEYQFDVLMGVDGKRNTLQGFQRKEFRGKLAIAITANFINRNTNAEASVEEISGVAFIFNQKFFLDLKAQTSIDLENIVYYKDETHYFVMTAKKASLLGKGVLKEDYMDTIQLLARDNVDQDALLSYAKEAADFSTNQQLPYLEYAVNHYGQADIAMFDFTSMFAAENACRAVERHGQKLLIGIAGDSLLEPFWPTGSGCARGFLGVFDAAWMVKSWASGKMTPLQVIAERESIYQFLSQTTPENLHKNHTQYCIDPNTRYPNLNFKTRLKPIQVKHLYDGPIDTDLLIEEATEGVPAKRSRNTGPSYNDDLIDSYSLLRWCQRVLNTGRFRNVHVVDFAGSWRSGLAFCALIHAFRPHLLDFNLLMESDVVKNNQMAFDIAEKEMGVPPVMTGEDMNNTQIPDKLTLVSYISQLYAVFRSDPLPTEEKDGFEANPSDPGDSPCRFFGMASKSVPGASPWQRNYDKMPEWVEEAASVRSDSDDGATDSDGTTVDGSLTIWGSAASWSDSSDSSDAEVYAPVCVESLKKLYEGPRGYTVSHQRTARSKSASAARKRKAADLPGTEDQGVSANPSEGNEFKTPSREGVETCSKTYISERRDDEHDNKRLSRENVDRVEVEGAAGCDEEMLIMPDVNTLKSRFSGGYDDSTVRKPTSPLKKSLSMSAVGDKKMRKSAMQQHGCRYFDSIPPIKLIESGSTMVQSPSKRAERKHSQAEMRSLSEREIDIEPLDFNYAKSKFQKPQKTEQQVLKKSSSFRAKQYPRSFIAIVTESHPKVAGLIFGGADSTTEERRSTAADTRNESSTDDVQELETKGDQGDASDTEHSGDEASKDDEGRLEFIGPQSVAERGIVDLGGTFCMLESESSTEAATPGRAHPRAADVILDALATDMDHEQDACIEDSYVHYVCEEGQDPLALQHISEIDDSLYQIACENAMVDDNDSEFADDPNDLAIVAAGSCLAHSLEKVSLSGNRGVSGGSHCANKTVNVSTPQTVLMNEADTSVLPTTDCNLPIPVRREPLRETSSDTMKSTDGIEESSDNGAIGGVTKDLNDGENADVGSLSSDDEFTEDVKTELAVDANTELAVDANTELTVDVNTELAVDANTELAVDANTELAVDANTELTVDANTELTVDANTELTVDVNTELAVDANTELAVDVNTELTVDANTELTVDANTELTVDANTELAVDANTELTVDANTELTVDANTELTVDANTAYC